MQEESKDGNLAKTLQVEYTTYIITKNLQLKPAHIRRDLAQFFTLSPTILARSSWTSTYENLRDSAHELESPQSLELDSPNAPKLIHSHPSINGRLCSISNNYCKYFNVDYNEELPKPNQFKPNYYCKYLSVDYNKEFPREISSHPFSHPENPAPFVTMTSILARWSWTQTYEN